ncbi:MAG: hypothetical protein AAF702_16420 [Chloroflexota bacterium]
MDKHEWHMGEESYLEVRAVPTTRAKSQHSDRQNELSSWRPVWNLLYAIGLLGLLFLIGYRLVTHEIESNSDRGQVHARLERSVAPQTDMQPLSEPQLLWQPPVDETILEIGE